MPLTLHECLLRSTALLQPCRHQLPSTERSKLRNTLNHCPKPEGVTLGCVSAVGHQPLRTESHKKPARSLLSLPSLPRCRVTQRLAQPQASAKQDLVPAASIKTIKFSACSKDTELKAPRTQSIRAWVRKSFSFPMRQPSC